MPRYTFLQTELHCPGCGTLITDLVWFQWGYTKGQLPTDSNTYRIGDQIRWRACADGTTPSWASWPDSGINLGDPSVRDLVTLDVISVGWEIDHCTDCQQPIAGAAVEIRGGAIQRCWIFAVGEFDLEIEYNLLEPDGSILPMVQWSNGSNHLWHRVSDERP